MPPNCTFCFHPVSPDCDAGDILLRSHPSQKVCVSCSASVKKIYGHKLLCRVQVLKQSSSVNLCDFFQRMTKVGTPEQTPVAKGNLNKKTQTFSLSYISPPTPPRSKKSELQRSSSCGGSTATRQRLCATTSYRLQKRADDTKGGYSLFKSRRSVRWADENGADLVTVHVIIDRSLRLSSMSSTLPLKSILRY